MKPRDNSSEEVQGLVGEGRAEPTSLAETLRRSQGSAARSASGVVAAPSAAVDEDEPTSVDPASLPLSGDQQAALARRIRNALENTLPLGTPVPPSVGASIGLRNSYARTMLLGGRQLPGVAVASGPGTSPAASAEPRRAAAPVDLLTPSATPAIVVPAPVPPPLPPSEPAPASGDMSALRASFVRTIGPPTVPPPRRSRRPGAPEREPGSEPDHEAFALDRPLLTPSAPAAGRKLGQVGPAGAQRASAPGPFSAPLSIGLVLPPPPQPGDYDAPSSPTAEAPPLSRAEAPSSPAAAPARLAPRMSAPRISVPPLLSDLPSANPFEGFEAPRETFAQRSLIVFIVALAVVGLFALAAIAFGFLGKTGW